MPSLLSLTELDRDAVSLAGRKAATLGALSGAGFPVPDGRVLDTGWYDAWTAQRLEEPRLREALRTALSELGPGPVAVRSSGVAEDGTEHALAGLFQSTLGVENEEQALEAVWACYRSVGRAGPHGDRGAMAVLVQRQVAPAAAGVAFTADPVTGERDVVCIEAVAGLADQLLEGRQDGERWRVQGAEARAEGASEVLSAALAGRVAETARQAAGWLGAPADVEWAVVDGAVIVLQVRAITALPAAPVPIVEEPPEGFWQRDDHSPTPTPITWDIWYAKYPQQLSAAIKHLGVPMEGMVACSYLGQVYSRIDTGGPDGPPPPGPVLWLVSRLLPMFRRSEKGLRAFIEGRGAMGLIDDYEQRQEPELLARSRALMAVEPGALGDDALLAHLAEAEQLIEDGGNVHALMGGAHMIPVGQLLVQAQEWLGWTDEESSELLAGYSPGTTDVERELAELAMPWADEPRLAELGWHDLRDALPELARALDDWCAWGGQRRLDYDIACATYAESPELVLPRIRDPRGTLARLDRARDEGRARAAARLDQARQALPPGRAAKLEQLVEDARRGVASRDLNAFGTLHMPIACFRRALLELGRRLTGRGDLDAPEHAFYLRLAELGPALGGALKDLPARIERRRGEHAWAQAHPGPATLGERPAEPDPRWFPPYLSMVFRMFARFEAPPAEEHPDDDALRGLAAGRGVAEGTVRIIRSPRELHRLRPGDVLVCECTGASWAMAYATAGAVVTDYGGWLSHPAILAREYGLPAVLGTHVATRTLVDGQRVRVDGNTGRVEVL